MNTAKACSSCGAELPADNESGVCSQCALKHKMESNIRHRLEGTATVSPPTKLQPAPMPAGAPIEIPAPGTTLQSLGEYELLEVIGEGGMGRVYKARQPLLKRLVAVKVLSPRLAEDRGFIRRFRREAAVAASLNHPNIVQVHTAGESSGVHYFVMELVDGESVQRRLRREGRLPASDAIAICLRVAYGLDYAWREGQVIHRDIKPDNIFLSRDGKTKLGDLGLAKNVSEGASSVTMSGQVVGTPHYISPEQARGKKNVDFRSDIYSLGCTLYHMLSGRPPFSGDSMFDLILKHVHEPAPNITEWIPDCPQGVDRLLSKMMAKDPDDRHQSYQELIVDLQQIQQGCGANIRPVKPARRIAKHFRWLGYGANIRPVKPAKSLKRFLNMLTAGFSTLKHGSLRRKRLEGHPPAELLPGLSAPKSRLPVPIATGVVALLLGSGGFYAYRSFTTCLVNITTDSPNVRVLCGTEEVGATPFAERMKPGPLTYSLKLDGYDDANIEVQAKAGNTTNVFVKMMPWSGELSGTSKPAGAKVAITVGDNFKLETNTPFKVNVPVGKGVMGGAAQAEVTAHFGNLLPKTKSVVVEKGQRSTVEFVFASGSVRLESEPSGATVLVDGLEVGKTPYASSNVAPGKVTYEFRLAGYNTEIVQLDVDANQTAWAQRQLTTASGVVVHSDPIGAEVVRRGVVLGRTPFMGKMDPGRQELTVRHQLLGEQPLVVDVQQNRTVTSEVRFARGGVQLTSEPAGAEVFVGGKLAGKTPYENPLVMPDKAVTYEVRKEVGGKMLSEALVLQVTDGQLLRTNVVLSSGRGVVVLTSNLAGAKIYWLTRAVEQLLGETGAALLRSAPIDKGLQKLVARHPVLGEQEIAVRVKPDAEVTAKVEFAYGSVVMRAVRADTDEPVDGAEVFAGDRKLGRLPWTDMMAKAGPVRYVVQAEGYVTKLVEGDVMAGRTNRFVAWLKLGQGTLELKSDPAGAEAFLDGKPIGKLPLTASAAAGTHQLLVKYQDKDPQSKQVKLKKGQTVREEFYFGTMRSSCGMELVRVSGVAGTVGGCWVGKYEVTQEEYEKVMGTNPSEAKGPRLPVVFVSFNDAAEFCRKLTEKDADKGVRYTLPTDEQWEFLMANARLEDSVTSKGRGEQRKQPEPVGSTGKPNKFGLFDVRGNVMEWCDAVGAAKTLRGGDYKGVSETGTLGAGYKLSRPGGVSLYSSGFRCLALPAK